MLVMRWVYKKRIYFIFQRIHPHCQCKASNAFCDHQYELVSMCYIHRTRWNFPLRFNFATHDAHNSTWVTNALITKVRGTHNYLCCKCRSLTNIHDEIMQCYAMQSQFKMASDHSLRAQKFQIFLGKHAPAPPQRYIVGSLCFFALELPVFTHTIYPT